MDNRTTQRRSGERRSVSPDTTKKMVLPNRERDSIVIRVHRHRMFLLKQRERFGFIDERGVIHLPKVAR